MHFLYAIHNKNEYIKMKKSSFILIIFILLQFNFNSLSFSANKNTSVKFSSTLKKAKTGNPKAMFLIARMLENGKGTQKNLREASKWYQRSASQNYAAANARLGKLYLEGTSVKKNPKKAFELLNLAAIQGIPSAQFNLALIYELGVGTKKDLQQAIKWYNVAAKNGYFAASSKSKKIQKQLGISNTLANIEADTLDTGTSIEKNPTQQGIGQIEELDEDLSEPEVIEIDPQDEDINQDDVVEVQSDELDESIIESETESETESDTEDEDITEDPMPIPKITTDVFTSPVADDEIDIEMNEPQVTQDELSIEHQVNSKIAQVKETEEQALLSNTFDRTESQASNKLLIKTKLNKKQKLELIRNENIRRTLKTLLEGRWFDKNQPVNFLPSPKTKCNIINKSDIKCISRQLQRQTDRETVYYKTLSKISKLTSRGSFLIQYQNTVVRVVSDEIKTQDGTLYQSNIKTGLQKLIHQLNCQYIDISNLICVRDKANKYNFKNRAILNKNADDSETIETE